MVPVVIRASVSAPTNQAEELRARFIELAPEGFEEVERAGGVELAAYGPAAESVLAAFPEAAVSEVGDDWPDRWREFHHSVRIGPLWVGPPWETPPTDAVSVVIDPGRAFGTGAHPTTRLSLELLFEQSRGSMVDLGCGSGVIAIAAARLGFSPVLALDIDEVAVEVTNSNAAANGAQLTARQADALVDELPEAGLVVANIALEAVGAIGRRLTAGSVITAGYLAVDVLELSGFTHVERRELDGWAADLFER